MFSEILTIRPQLDQSDLRRMERSLSSRFQRVAKSFGSGLRKVFSGAGILGVIGIITDRLLNPLREVQSTLDRVLAASGDIATFAKQFDTTTGSFLKLQTLTRSEGIDQGRLILSLRRFQLEVEKARQDPEADTPVRAFTKFQDTAEGFFQFLQSLQRADTTTRNLVSRKVLGERGSIEFSGLIAPDFDYAERLRRLGVGDLTSKTLSEDVKKLDQLSNLKNILQAQRELREIRGTARVANENTIQQLNRSAEIEQDRNFNRIATIEDVARVSRGVDHLLNVIEKSFQTLGGFLTDLVKFAEKLTGISVDINNIFKIIQDFRKGTFSKFLNRFSGGSE